VMPNAMLSGARDNRMQTDAITRQPPTLTRVRSN
jgi:hypothetical protein